jgi:hypothetical protein
MSKLYAQMRQVFNLSIIIVLKSDVQIYWPMEGIRSSSEDVERVDLIVRSSPLCACQHNKHSKRKESGLI